MTEGDDPNLKAVEALIAAGYMVKRFDEDPELWQVNGDVTTGVELTAEARRMGLIDVPGPLQ